MSTSSVDDRHDNSESVEFLCMGLLMVHYSASQCLNNDKRWRFTKFLSILLPPCPRFVVSYHCPVDDSSERLPILV